MTNTIYLDDKYSTTRLLTQDKPKIINNLDDKFETILFLPMGENRKGEGGLRTKGYYKNTYEGKPLISIITVVFNGEKYLEETIQSVINQTYDNVEYIIIDGGSTDGTLDVIKKYEDKIDYWVSERDNGIYDAWNKGVVCSAGDWIGFLGADDMLHMESLAQYMNEVQNYANVDIEYISSKIKLIDSQNNLIRIVGQKWNWKDFAKFMNVAHVGSLHNKKLYIRFGLYDLNFKISGDYEFLLRPGYLLKAQFLNYETACMRIGGVSDGNFLVFLETYRAKLKHHTRPYFFVVFFEMIFGYLKWKIRHMVWY